MNFALPLAPPARSKLEDSHRLEMCKIGRWMYRRGLVVACQGNLSVRTQDDRVLLTPGGVCKGHLRPRDLLVTDLDGMLVSGSGKPSSELQMHLLFYRERPDVRAVCHAHPPTATGFAAAGRGLEEAILPEIVVLLGKIPLAPYGTPGTWDVCAGLESLVPQHDAILLENHGVVTCGKDLMTAFHRMETVEQFAKIVLTAEALGGARRLSREQVETLVAARPRYGVSLPAVAVEPPMTADAKAVRVPRPRRDFKPFYKHHALR
ncbi:MAG TPA: class II aldolase/adducin family protein [Candidatus Binatia bacterium]|nr:class II aldolase/adducin family protein [Candidatus Binatia bacterium]